MQYPPLTWTNYNDWALMMRVNMEAQGIWHAVEPEDDETIECRVNRLVLAAILWAVPPDMLSSLVTKRTAQSVGEAIKFQHIGVQRVRKANAEKLR